MNVKTICINSMLGALLFAIYFTFSQILYLEFVTFTIILFAMCLPKYNSVIVTVIFVFLVWFAYGIGTWSMMYMIIYPGFSYLFCLSRKRIKNNLWLLASCGFIMGLLAGNLVDLPFLLIAKEITPIYILLGLQTTLTQAAIAAISIIILYEPLSNVLTNLLESKNIY